MSYVLRVTAAYVVLVGVAVAVHFIITPFYHAGDAPFTLWHYMNWLIAPAMLVTVVASYASKRRMDGAGTVDLKRYLEVNTVFYGSVAAAIVFFWNWFLELTPANVSDHQFWHVLGAVLPILMVVAGLRLWSMPKGRRAVLPIDGKGCPAETRASGAGHETGRTVVGGGRRCGELDRGSG